jgi:hypothetical protein
MRVLGGIFLYDPQSDLRCISNVNFCQQAPGPAKAPALKNLMPSPVTTRGRPPESPPPQFESQSNAKPNQLHLIPVTIDP